MTSYTMNKLQLGQSASFTKTITETDVRLFAQLSGDSNPVHLDESFAKDTIFKSRIAHGMLCGSLISTVLGMYLPGPGSIYLKQELKFMAPVYFGDTLTATCSVKEKIVEKNRVILDCKVINQNDVVVISGEATIMPPKSE